MEYQLSGFESPTRLDYLDTLYPSPHRLVPEDVLQCAPCCQAQHFGFDHKFMVDNSLVDTIHLDCSGGCPLKCRTFARIETPSVPCQEQPRCSSAELDDTLYESPYDLIRNAQLQRVHTMPMQQASHGAAPGTPHNSSTQGTIRPAAGQEAFSKYPGDDLTEEFMTELDLLSELYLSEEALNGDLLDLSEIYDSTSPLAPTNTPSDSISDKGLFSDLAPMATSAQCRMDSAVNPSTANSTYECRSTGTPTDTELQLIQSQQEQGARQTSSHEAEWHMCTFCRRPFARLQYLKQHIIVHTEEKPFGCLACPKVFGRAADRKRHERLHSGARPHTCSRCARGFARRDALIRHKAKCFTDR